MKEAALGPQSSRMEHPRRIPWLFVSVEVQTHPGGAQVEVAGKGLAAAYPGRTVRSPGAPPWGATDPAAGAPDPVGWRRRGPLAARARSGSGGASSLRGMRPRRRPHSPLPGRVGEDLLGAALGGGGRGAPPVRGGPAAAVLEPGRTSARGALRRRRGGGREGGRRGGGRRRSARSPTFLTPFVLPCDDGKGSFDLKLGFFVYLNISTSFAKRERRISVNHFSFRS